MHSFIAFLGNNPSLSLAELAGVFDDFTVQGFPQPQIVFFDTAKEVNQATLSRLGGTILIGKRITSDAVGLKDIPTLLAAELTGVKGKATFALRFVGVPPHAAKNLYKDSKNGLRQRGIASRYIGSERDAAKPIQLHDEGILDPKRGVELIIVQGKTGVWMGKTVAAQDVKAYTLRDIEKPVRDTTVGLLPPKLAQMLLNFGEYLVRNSKVQEKNSKQKLLVFDPFCGTGVIPIEAMLRGCDVLASDVSEKAVNGCTKNVEWVRKTYKILKKDIDATIWKQDATKPFDLKDKPAVIVTEGSLGPALSARATVKDAEAYRSKADDLVCRFLENAATTLPGTPIVMTMPVWYAQKKLIPLTKVWDTIAKLGYRAVLPPHTNPSMEGRFSLLYRRADQFVGREIVLLQAKKS